MSQVRFQVLFGPVEPAAVASDDGRTDWYGWRMMGANNRELGRSAAGSVSYQTARLAIMHLKQGVGRVVVHTTHDPATGLWAWRVGLDGSPVAVSGRWYERDHDARVGAEKFVSLAADAALVDGVLTVHDARGLGVVHLRGGGGR